MSKTIVQTHKILDNHLDVPLEYHLPTNYTNDPIEMIMKKSYWDEVYTEIVNKDFTRLLNILSEMKQMLKDLVPNRKDMHKEIDEYIDIPFVKQKIEHTVFDTEEFINLFSCYITWTKKLGPPCDDEMMDSLCDKVINEAVEKGHIYILPYAYDTLHTQLVKIYKDSLVYRQKIAEKFYSDI